MPTEYIDVGSNSHTNDDGEPLRRIIGRRIKARTGKVWSGTKAVASEPVVWIITGSVGVSWLMMERAAQLDRETRIRLENLRHLDNLSATFQKLTDGPSPVVEFAVRNEQRPEHEKVWTFDANALDETLERQDFLFTPASQ